MWGAGPVWGARVRLRLTNPDDPWGPRPPSSPGAPINNLGHQEQLSDPSFTVGVAPNVDTLYSLAWLDLHEGPFTFETPDFGDRYHTFQFGTADTECHTCLGSRTHGSRLPPLFIHGPGTAEPPPAGMKAVTSPTRYLMVAGRVLVDSRVAGDTEHVRALQSHMRLTTWRRYQAGDVTGSNPVSHQRPLADTDTEVPDDLMPLHEIGNVLADWTPLEHEVDLLRSFGAIHLGVGDGFDHRALTKRERDAAVRGVEMGRHLVSQATKQFGTVRNGWSMNLQGPDFRDDYLLRAAVAEHQVYVVPPDEALYPSTSVDVDGRPLDGQWAYDINMAPGELPPVDAFWSLTMYTAAGRLVSNALDRHAIGDRTPGLQMRRDGGLTIRLAREQPSEPEVNWLPTPDGPFRILLRLYHPEPAALSGSWRPPPVRRRPTHATASTIRSET